MKEKSVHVARFWINKKEEETTFANNLAEIKLFENNKKKSPVKDCGAEVAKGGAERDPEEEGENQLETFSKPVNIFSPAGPSDFTEPFVGRSVQPPIPFISIPHTLYGKIISDPREN